MEELQENQQDKEQQTSSLELENQRLREENELLKEYRNSLPLKERMYDRVNVSVKTMDIFIGCMVVLLILVLIFGMANR